MSKQITYFDDYFKSGDYEESIFETLGMKFETYVFENKDSANEFIEKNGTNIYGVIGVDEDERIHVTRNDAKGINVNE